LAFHLVPEVAHRPAGPRAKLGFEVEDQGVARGLPATSLAPCWRSLAPVVMVAMYTVPGSSGAVDVKVVSPR
jgi:hypothetical protein